MNTGKHLVRVLALIGSAISVLTASTVVADPAATRVYTLTPSSHGNPEGVAFDRQSSAFFVGATGDGTIYRGALDRPDVVEFIPGAPGKDAVGIKVANGRLYVAGGVTGDLLIYDLVSRRQVGAFATGTGGFVNDLAITPSGDVFMTDSFRPTLWHVTAAQVAAGQGTPEAIAVAPEVVYQAGQFNLNGIVALGDHRLVAVQTITGALFRIDLDRATRRIQQVAVEPVVGGDGLLLDHDRLIVVQGTPAQLTFIQLDRSASRGTVVGHLTDPTFRGPSTVARARGRYLVVNLDLAGVPPFTVSGVVRPDDGADDDPAEEME